MLNPSRGHTSFAAIGYPTSKTSNVEAFDLLPSFQISHCVNCLRLSHVSEDNNCNSVHKGAAEHELNIDEAS